LPDFTGDAAFAASFVTDAEAFATAFAGRLASALRATSANGAFVRDDVDGFDFAAAFLDFEAALAMM
jgi:hypothetical protein